MKQSEFGFKCNYSMFALKRIHQRAADIFKDISSIRLNHWPMTIINFPLSMFHFPSRVVYIHFEYRKNEDYGT